MDHQQKLQQERETWKKLIQDFHGSGLSAAEFSKANDLSVHQFYYWKAKYTEISEKKTSLIKKANPGPLIKVISKSSANTKKLPDPSWLAALIKALHENS